MPRSGSKRQVFVNCPFDAAYTELFNALMFTIYDCGFQPRCAKEVDTGDQRFPKICEIIRECPLGIHDISRTTLDLKTKLPRFNMPLERGCFWATRRSSKTTKRYWSWTRPSFAIKSFCSDSAGIDIQPHNERPRNLVRVVRNWLSMNQEVKETIPDGTEIFDRYGQFMVDRPTICKRLRLRIREFSTPITSRSSNRGCWRMTGDPLRPPTLPHLIRRSPVELYLNRDR